MMSLVELKDGMVKALKKRIELFYRNSVDLHEKALKRGRGAYFIMPANNFGDLIHDAVPSATYITQEMVSEIEYAVAIEHVAKYDPKRQFVMIASIVLDKARVLKGQKDAYFLSMIIPREAYNLIAGAHADEPSQALDTIPKLKHVCICCGARTNRKCANCESVSYCSPEHQKGHWAIHKQECSKLKECKHKVKQLLPLDDLDN